MPDHTKHLCQTCPKNRYSNSSWALKKLCWLPIQQRTEYKILTTTFKYITGMAPKYLQDLIIIKDYIQDSMCSNNTSTILHIRKVKYQAFMTWSFRYSVPTSWNQLPKSIKDSQNLDIFRKKLKMHLFQHAFNLN